MSYIVKGTLEIEAKLDAIIMENEHIVVDALRYGAVAVRDEAKQHHTFKNRTHNLENSIQVQPGVGRTAGGTLYVQVYAGMPYAGWVEFGTSKMDARPFLTPALFKKRTLIHDVMEAALRQAYR